MFALDYSLLYYFVLWISLALASFVFIMINGIDYVSWPRLIPSTDVIYYDGPGFRSGNNGKGFGGKAGRVAAKTEWLSNKHMRGKSRTEEIELGNIKKRVD